MNKIKMAFIAIAILTAVGGAFATTCTACDSADQYIYTGNGYSRVGTYGVNYDCYVTGGICTFYKPDPFAQPNVYAPCHEGLYTPF